MKPSKHDIYKKQQLTEVASPKIVRKRRRWFAIAISAVASLFVAIAAFGLTPASGGLAGGITITINNGPGDQTDPHVNGNLAVYTNSNGSSQIRYYDFVTTSDNAIPPAPGADDILSDVFGNLIAFTRVSGGTTAMLFDVTTNTVTEIAPMPSPAQFSPVLGGHYVAFIDLNLGNGDIMVFDLSTNGPLVNVSMSSEADDGPSLSPSGNAVVWERCAGPNCDILRSVQSGGTWGAAEVVSATPSNEGNPDTDGTWVVYDSNRPSATGGDIYFQPLSGGPETQLQIAGEQRNPSISSGVIAFESDPGSGSADIYVYVIATSTMYQVTNSPTVNDTLNDVTVLGTGEVRVVWSANDGPGQNVYARTFSIPLGGDSTAPTVTITTPANGATYVKGQSVAADFLCQDEPGGSGLASCTGSVISGAPIDTATVGSHSFSVTATDNAGNSTTATNTYNVVDNFIVFESLRNGNLDIYSMNANGSNQTRLTTNAALDANPVWSPDHSKIAFTSTRDGNLEIYVMNADASNQTRLTNDAAIDDDPSWSPDGTRIAFWSSRNGNPEIYVMNANGTNPTRLTNNSALDIHPGWSPDGSKIVFTSNRDGLFNAEIYVMNSDGSGVNRLTNDPAIDDSPDWSPDGTKIVFASNRTGLLRFEIWVMNANGANPVQLTTGPRASVAPSWAPNGAQIVFATNRDNLFTFEIYSMNADGSNPRRLTSNNLQDFAPNW